MSNPNKTTEQQNQLVADAKIKISNTLRRLRKLNVNLDFIHSTYQPPDYGNPVSVNKLRLSELHTQLNDALDTLNKLTPSKPNLVSLHDVKIQIRPTTDIDTITKVIRNLRSE